MNNLKSPFNHLEERQMHFNNGEFAFQYNSEPDYISLPALRDTSSFLISRMGLLKSVV